MNEESLYLESVELLKELISTQSFSFHEENTATLLENWLNKNSIPFKRHVNNIYCYNKYYNEGKPNILLNSHHDTVEPNDSYTNDPYEPIVDQGKLYGLGSNDAGASLVSLLSTFKFFYDCKNLNCNLIFLASAEEEKSGKNGIKSVIPKLPKIDFAIIGEPTKMEIAIAEKGLIVFDLMIEGTSSHAAHPNTNNPIQKINKIIDQINALDFNKVSKTLGKVKVTITQINAGKQHNVVPSNVKMVVDVRVNDLYSNKEILEIFQQNVDCKILPRNLELNSKSIDSNHQINYVAKKLNINTYGSPTLSDQSKIKCDSVKIGPGDSERSHTANEFVFLDEIKEAIPKYIKILETLKI